MNTKVLTGSLLCISLLSGCSEQNINRTVSTEPVAFDIKAKLKSANITPIINSTKQQVGSTFDLIDDPSSLNFVTITVENTIAYSEPNRNSTQLAILTQNATFPYLKQQAKTEETIWYKIQLKDGQIGYVLNSESSLSEKPQANSNTTLTVGNAIRVTSNGGNVRKNPEITSNVVYSISKGSALYATGNAIQTTDGRTWYEVYINKKVGTGYISSAITEIIPVSEKSQRFMVNASMANVRLTPNIESAILYKARKGETLTYLNDQITDNQGRTWYFVRVGEHAFGYISSNVGYIQ